MVSFIIVPTCESLPLSPSSNCQCSGSTRHAGPVRQRALFRRRWSPFESRLSRFLELAEDERDFSDHTEGLENMWQLSSLLLHPRDRRNGSAKKESDSDNNQSAETIKQVSGKAEQKLSPEDERRSDKFSVSVELADAFKPSEISVKVDGKILKIDGKHEEKGDDGHVFCRQFARSYYLPDDVDIENLTSALSKKGVLSVEAPKLQLKEETSEERNIPIQQTTSPEAVEEKKSEEAKKCEEEKNSEGGEKEMRPTENKPNKGNWKLQ